MKPPTWDGKAVCVMNMGPGEDRRQVEVSLTEDAARKLSLALARLKQTTFALPDECQELLDALNFVTVGDPASRAARSAMEAGKGMTPDGGFKAPERKRGSEWKVKAAGEWGPRDGS